MTSGHAKAKRRERNRERIKRVRAAMHRTNPCCRRCGVPTILSSGAFETKKLEQSGSPWRDRMATIDHKFTRYDAAQRANPVNGEQRWKLVCSKCNGELARERELQVPLEERQRRAGRFPQKVDG